MTNSPAPTRRVGAYHRTLHLWLCLALIVPILVSSGTPARADDAVIQYGPSRSKVATRMELEIDNVHIYDDREPFYEFGGEIRLEARIWRMKQEEGCPRWTNSPSTDCVVELEKTIVKFSGSTGETVPIARTLPEQESGGRDRNSERSGPGIGIPMYADEVYGWEISGVDEDFLIDDRMGWLVGEISQANNWGTPGEYDERGWVQCDELQYDMCVISLVEDPYNLPGAKAAHFSVQYKLRHTALPDLAASGFRYDTQRGAICMRVANLGARPADPFEILFYADATPSAASAQQSYSFGQGLGVNESQEPCLNPLLPAGERAVSFIVDADDHVLEGNESNNRYDSKFTFVAFPSSGAQSVAPPPNQGTAPTPTPTPGPKTVDLVVNGIQIKGEQSGGRSGCDPGKNDVTVSITNYGTGPAASFVVRLTAKPEDDDADEIAVEQTVTELGAGAEDAVQFDDLRLSKGRYDLEATVDAKNTVAESNQNNNKEKISVNCQV